MNKRVKYVFSLLPSFLTQYAYWLSNQRGILLEELDLIYVPIPKVANRSIKEALTAKLGWSGRISAHKYPWKTIAISRISERKEQSFAFVRNPLDRLVSCYLQKIASERAANQFWKYGNKIKANMSFDEFVDFVCKTPDAISDRHFKSQHCFIYREGKNVVDFIGKFENLEVDFKKAFPKTDPPALPHANKSNRMDWKNYYSKSLADKVAKRYAKDIVLFSYEEEVKSFLS